jgi:hypothetical protein
VVFFWSLDGFNCEIARKAMLAQPGAIRGLGLKWFCSKVHEHRELGRRFMLHGVSTWFFFYRGERPGRATGRHTPGNSRQRSRRPGKRSGPPFPQAAGKLMERIRAKVRPIEKK